jgi:hypothetical protein
MMFDVVMSGILMQIVTSPGHIQVNISHLYDAESLHC